ncbi:hypothetical protein J6590_002126 [Homalodisca vitripennis]|nr:hypothetical protein J6590_002126 [Homalodisca vitripennis]
MDNTESDPAQLGGLFVYREMNGRSCTVPIILFTFLTLAARKRRGRIDDRCGCNRGGSATEREICDRGEGSGGLESSSLLLVAVVLTQLFTCVVLWI